MIEVNKIHNMNCLDGMKLIPDNTIDLTITSPPYDNLREYKGYSFDFEGIAKELFRITKEGGVVVWVVNDETKDGSESGTSFKQALFFKEIGFNLHDTMLYHKLNPVPMNHRRYEPEFEYMFVLVKGRLKTFNPIMVPTISHGKVQDYSKRKSAATKEKKGGARLADKKLEVKRFKQKGNIWSYVIGESSTSDKEAFQHPATFPEQLVSDHIISWSNEGDLVFDPFMGSGTTGKIAYLMKRDFLGFEISEEYIELAIRRINKAKSQKRLF